MSCIAVRHYKVGPCTHKVFKEERCKLHYNGMVSTGIKHVLESEMIQKQANEIAILQTKIWENEDHGLREELEVLEVRHKHEMGRMERRLALMPDTPADRAHRRKVQERQQRREELQRIRYEERWDLRGNQDLGPAQEHEEPQDDLIGFAADRQNIHREVTVNEVVKKTIQKVILIPVPAEYRWNMETVAKTPGEIIAECKISIAAGKLLVEKYTSDETIYDMVSGIYGKTLDSVWQYIKSSSDKEVLIKTLKIELEDNIGMCAQGNLTRLCNVLQGYIDDMPKPSIAEVLGDLLPPLMAIKDRRVRREKALQIMRTHNVPDEEHDAWLDELNDDDDDGDEIRRAYLDSLRMDYYPD
jgi:hypothetical protein